MMGWFKNISNSVKIRLLLIFFIVLVLFSAIQAAFLEYVIVKEKQQSIQNYISSQRQYFEQCIDHSSLEAPLLYSSCFHPINEWIDSNLYLYNSNNALIWTSQSQDISNFDPRVLILPEKRKLYSEYDFSISTFTILENTRTLIISIPVNIIGKQVSILRWKLFSFFVLLIVLSSSGLYWWLKKGFRAVDQMAVNLERIAAGKSHQLEGLYEAEFANMQMSLNNLLNAEKQQRERYRNTLADLAHSLKTPLAVLQGTFNEKLSHEEYLSITKEQLRRMDQIIQYQLNRAVKSIGDGTKTSAVSVTPIIERILSALGKVYREKDVRAILNLDKRIELIADERDLMEVIGNMLENAYKYCRSEVAVTLYSDQDNVYILLEDDGPGVSENMRYTILERGERADTSAAPGQGLGLSVAVDILSSYNCRLEVEDSLSLGGAKFSISFPKF